MYDVELLDEELEALEDELLDDELLRVCPLGQVCAAVATAEPLPPPYFTLDEPLLELTE